MFSIAVAGLAKLLIAVTVSLHPAAPPAHYTVRSGDTLSGIARHEYGSAADWPALWWINRHAVPNPDVIAAGQRLALSTWHPRQAWLDRAARAAIAGGMRPIFDAGLLAVIEGDTTVEEVVRCIRGEA